MKTNYTPEQPLAYCILYFMTKPLERNKEKKRMRKYTCCRFLDLRIRLPRKVKSYMIDILNGQRFKCYVYLCAPACIAMEPFASSCCRSCRRRHVGITTLAAAALAAATLGPLAVSKVKTSAGSCRTNPSYASTPQ